MKLRVWLDLARAGNFPSVAGNVLAALVLSAPGFPFHAIVPLGLAVIAGWLVYAGGATFNDVADATFDARHRPERAIPRGAVRRATAASVATAQMAAGLGLFIVAGASPFWAAALAVVILAYDWTHKRWTGSVVLMAGCRVLLGLTVASLPGHGVTPALLAWLGVLFAYIVVLSLLARREYLPGAPAAKIGRSVGRLLAFIPFVDAVALLVCGAWVPAVLCALMVPLGRWAQRVVAAN
ncbi:MAG: UbiA family prenyltransferase [Verrucomicrobiota bacterium]|jgi:4-hydroxybenzoate polyprenyltransferase|nr:UbiA family prenyltransferase [Opitutaceae bacterium]